MSRAVEARWAEEIARGTRWGSTTEGEGSTRLGESVGNPPGHPGMQSLPMGAAMKRKSPRLEEMASAKEIARPTSAIGAFSRPGQNVAHSVSLTHGYQRTAELLAHTPPPPSLTGYRLAKYSQETCNLRFQRSRRRRQRLRGRRAHRHHLQSQLRRHRLLRRIGAM